MRQDSHLIFEGWKDKVLPTALGVSLGLGIPAGIKKSLDSGELSHQEKIDRASSIFQSAIVLADMPIENAAELYVNLTAEVPLEDYKKLKAGLEQFSKTLPSLDKRKKAEDLQTEIDYKIKEYYIDRWSEKDEDAEKVVTQPYLNNANNEEVLTQYQQSWQGAGGGFGKGYKTKGGTNVPKALG